MWSTNKKTHTAPSARRAHKLSQRLTTRKPPITPVTMNSHHKKRTCEQWTSSAKAWAHNAVCRSTTSRLDGKRERERGSAGSMSENFSRNYSNIFLVKISLLFLASSFWQKFEKLFWAKKVERQRDRTEEQRNQRTCCEREIMCPAATHISVSFSLRELWRKR